MERKSKTHPASIIFEAEGVVLPQFLPTEMGGERPVPALFQFRPGESIVGRKQFVVFQSENETAALIFRGVRDLHYTPKPEAVDQREDRRRRGATSRSQKGKPRTFLFPPVFVSRGNAIRDIVSIVPLIEKIKLFSFFLSSLFSFFFPAATFASTKRWIGFLVDECSSRLGVTELHARTWNRNWKFLSVIESKAKSTRMMDTFLFLRLVKGII